MFSLPRVIRGKVGSCSSEPGPHGPGEVKVVDACQQPKKGLLSEILRSCNIGGATSEEPDEAGEEVAIEKIEGLLFGREEVRNVASVISFGESLL